jgi:hypothetical protein
MSKLSLRLSAIAFAVLGSSQSELAAQHLRIGVVGGTALTRDYATHTEPGYPFQFPDGSVGFFPGYTVGSGSRSFIGGPALGWEFNDKYSVETNAIYRRLHLSVPGPTVTWEFPLLFKYRTRIGGVRPFVEAGPAFRTTGNLNTTPSHFGVSAGTGVDLDWGRFRLSPTVRYTRWSADPEGSRPSSKQDQVELLLQFSGRGESDTKPFGRRVRLGVAAGWTVNRAGRDFQFGYSDAVYGLFETRRNYLVSWIVGPRAEVEVTERLGVTVEANYRQVRYREKVRFDYVDPVGRPVRGEGEYSGKSAVLWQFPVLARYRVTNWRVAPIVEAGPSFRLPQEIGAWLSQYGVTGGAGVQWNWKGVRFSPGLRFTHWGGATYRNGDTAPNSTRRNQLDAMVGVTF